MTAPDAGSDPEGFTLNHIAIMVPELEPGVDWYSSKLGARLIDRWSNPDNGMEWAHLGIGDFTLELVRFPDLPVVPGRKAGYHHLGITVPDCDAAVLHLQAQGVEVIMPPSDFDRHGIRWAFVKDYLGNVIEIISNRQGREAAAHG